MDSSEALNAFWNSFGWEAIDEMSSYDEGAIEALNIPDHYITYEVQIGELGEPVALTGSLWHRSTSWALIEAKAQQICRTIGEGGIKQPYTGGQIWITRRMPSYQRMPDESNYDMRRIIININAEFLSA